MIPLEHVLALSAALFALGALGFVVRRHWILVLLAAQVMLSAVAIALVAFDRWHAVAPAAVSPAAGAAMPGQVLSLFAIAIGAAQVAIGFGLAVAIVRNRDSLDVEDLNLLRW